MKTKPPRFVEGRVGYAVGDIHGRADLLARMFESLEADAAASRAERPIVIFLGDYVDRGPDSCEVLDLLALGRPEGFERRFLKGNHEQAMLAFLEDPIANRAWLAHGGLETVASFGVFPLPSAGANAEALRECSVALRGRMSSAHMRFFAELDRFALLGDYLFAHAGVDPKLPLERQTDHDFLWSRDRFLKDRRSLPWVVVHGHTPEKAPHRDERRIGLDTGAYYSGLLSAARFQGETVTFITVSATASAV